jgi:hypothetical protein
MAFIVIYDAKVLYPNTLRDLLIRIGQAGLVQARWTNEILDEMLRERQPIRRSGRDPGPRPYARITPKPRKQGRKHLPTSSLPIRGPGRHRI